MISIVSSKEFGESYHCLKQNGKDETSRVFGVIEVPTVFAEYGNLEFSQKIIRFWRDFQMTELRVTFFLFQNPVDCNIDLKANDM